MDWNQILNRLPLDRIIKHFLFPLSVVFAIAALFLSIRTFSELQQSSISNAFATVQSVEDAYRLENAYPSAVFLSTADRHFETYWIVSETGDILETSGNVAVGTRLDADLWSMAEASQDGNILHDYSAEGESYVIAGSLNASDGFWVIVQLTPPFVFTTIISLILAILALSLMSVTGLIATQFLKKEKTGASKATGRAQKGLDKIDTSKMNLSNWQVGGDGGPVLINGDAKEGFQNLHEAVLQAKDDFVIVLDRDRKLIYSNPVIELTEVEVLSNVDGLTAFSDRFLDVNARMRFDDWLNSDAEARTLIMDVLGKDGVSHPTRWTTQTLETASGTNFEVFVGHRMILEEFPTMSF